MYAVIKTGGKQYRVAKDDVVTIERIAGEAGSTIEFGEVLLVGSGADVKVGAPTVAGAKVTAELVGDTRGPKLIAFKKRRRKNSRRKKGHRQDLSTVRITSITGA
jgi:large subunit ribosomal protein L21